MKESAEKHDYEIRASRALGFGGSDAAMVLAIADKLSNREPLTSIMKKRLRVIKGIDPIPSRVTSGAIEHGRQFEDEMYGVLREQNLFGLEREKLLEPNNQNYPFKVFAHADFYVAERATVIECKWSGALTHEELKNKYMPQLQWYYMLGASAVKLCTRTESDSDKQDLIEYIVMDPELTGKIEMSLDVIASNWDLMDLELNEAEDGELRDDIISAMLRMAEIKDEIESRDKEYKELSAEVMKWMKDNELSKIKHLGISVTYTQESTSTRFDSAGLKKAYPKIYEMFASFSQKKEFLTLKR